MTTITAYAGAFTLADEGVHPVPEGNDNPDWSESFFFSFYDDEAGVGGAFRVGQELNNGTANCWYGIMSAEGWRYLHNGQDHPITDADRTEHGPRHLVGERVEPPRLRRAGHRHVHRRAARTPRSTCASRTTTR